MYLLRGELWTRLQCESGVGHATELSQLLIEHCEIPVSETDRPGVTPERKLDRVEPVSPVSTFRFDIFLDL